MMATFRDGADGASSERLIGEAASEPREEERFAR